MPERITVPYCQMSRYELKSVTGTKNLQGNGGQ